MKVTLHLEGSTTEMVQQCEEFAAALSSGEVSNTAPAKPGKPAKGAAKAPKKEESEEEESATEDGGQEAEEEEFGDLDGEPAAEEEEETKISDKEMLDAFQAFAAGKDKKKKGNRDAAKAILQKLKVKAVKDIPQEKRAEVLKQVK